MATATIDWVATNGSTYEVWYAPLSIVGTTSLPPSTGWVQATGSPFSSTLGTASITGLQDNTQYRVDVRSDCSGTDSTWIDNIKYNLVCPSLTVVANPIGGTEVGASITATTTMENYIDFEAIVTSMTIFVYGPGGGAPVQQKNYTAPFTNPITTVFSNLLAGTTYSLDLQIYDNIASVLKDCGGSSITTQSTVVPPPTCTAPTFTLSAITASSVTVNITSSIATGDTFDISTNGGSSYISIGNTASPVTLTGLMQGTTYQIVVRRDCIVGGIGTSSSQTFTTANQVLSGTITMNSNINSQTAPFATIGTLYLTFTFPQPTPFPVTLYFGYLHNDSCATSYCSTGTCYRANGTNIFSLPSGICYATAPPGNYVDGYDTSGTGDWPFVVTIPQGVTAYNSGTNIKTAFPTTQNAWHNNSTRNALGSSGHIGSGYTDLYVHVQSPTGYTASFTIFPSINILNVSLHNV